ncbi:unnamed protein product, partial [Didymodactylos carnosus]
PSTSTSLSPQHQQQRDKIVTQLHLALASSRNH